MQLYIRDRSRHVVFLHNIDELKEFEENYMGQDVVIGDLYYFNKAMTQRLLKFLEDNPSIGCYSSYDLTDPVLCSRFSVVKKMPLESNVQELGDNVTYYGVLHGTSYESELKLHYVEKPELRNFIKACQSK